MTSRRDPFSFDALDPSGVTYKVLIREKRLLALAKLGPAALLEARHLLPQALQAPTVIFQGLRWEGDEDKDRPGWRCYVSKLKFMYDKRGDVVASDPTEVFLVFVNDQMIAYNWRWEAADQDDPEIPINSGSRFHEKIYDYREGKKA
jgi:hypothetical protein